LGESVAAVMRGMESQEAWPVSAAVSAFSGLALIFGVWWWYFDVAHGAAERHVRSARDTVSFHIWSHAHFPLYLCIAVLGVGIQHVISLPAGIRATPQHAWILTGAASVLMSILCVISLTCTRSESQFRLLPNLLVLAVLLSAPVLSHFAPSCVLVIEASLVCAAGIFLERFREGRLVRVNGRSRPHPALDNPAVPADYA
jgi:low temperature requirement protein LtrA